MILNFNFIGDFLRTVKSGKLQKEPVEKSSIKIGKPPAKKPRQYCRKLFEHFLHLFKKEYMKTAKELFKLFKLSFSTYFNFLFLEIVT